MGDALLFFGLALLVIVAGLRIRSRLLRSRRRGLTPEMVREIEERGSLRWEPEESLDLEEIRREEDAFWDRSWDEPEEL